MSKLRFPADVDVIIQGELSVTGTAPEIPRSRIVQDSIQVYPVNLMDFRVHDAPHTNLPGTSATDDLAIDGVTFGTNSVRLSTYDVKTVGATTLYGRAFVPVAIEYVAGQTAQFRISCGMVTTVADTSATIDVEAYRVDREGAVSGTDLVTTAATDCNSLTFADKDFAMTVSALQPGDWLDVRVALAINDGAGGAAVIGRIGSVELMLDVKG